MARTDSAAVKVLVRGPMFVTVQPDKDVTDGMLQADDI